MNTFLLVFLSVIFPSLVDCTPKDSLSNHDFFIEKIHSGSSIPREQYVSLDSSNIFQRTKRRLNEESNGEVLLVRYLADQKIYVGEFFSLPISVYDYFYDTNGDNLTLTTILEDGSPPIAFLNFNGSHLFGEASSEDIGSYILGLEATNSVGNKGLKAISLSVEEPESVNSHQKNKDFVFHEPEKSGLFTVVEIIGAMLMMMTAILVIKVCLFCFPSFKEPISRLSD